MSTYFTKHSDIDRKWHVVDAKGQVLGRLATRLANILVGKHKPTYTPHIDNGDYIVVINMKDVHLTGKKWDDKLYYRHTGFPGGIKVRTAKEQFARKPEEILRKAVWGMMNKSNLARRQLMKLKIYTGPEHPHLAQNPKPLVISAAARK